MSKPFVHRLSRGAAAAAILLAGFAGTARAEVAAVNLRTEYTPATDFAGVRVRFASLADPDVVFWADHLALGGLDYETDWVRVAEIDAPLGDYQLTVDLVDGYGGIVARWSALTEFDSARIFNVEASKPWGRAEKSVELVEDADGDGAISGGDRLRYTVVALGLVGRGFTDDLDPGLALVAGSVSTTHGLVLEGNVAGDRRVVIVDMAFGDVDAAVVEFDATVLPEVANQGEILVEQGFYVPGSWGGLYASARIPTDDPSTPTPDDPTRSAVACGLAGCQDDLDACTEDLDSCEDGWNECSADLSTCAAERAALAAEVTALEAQLAALLDDSDGDGVPAVADACPASAAGAGVDAHGCSLAEFCGALDLDAPQGESVCRNADWGNDEPIGNPRDCRPSGGFCVAD